MSTRRTHIQALMSLPLILGGASACRGDYSFKLIGQKLPDMDLGLVDGGRINLSKLGRPAVIRFWGLWCDECKRDEGHWDKVVQALKHERSITLLSVHTGLVPPDGPSLSSWSKARAPEVHVPIVDDTEGHLADALKMPGVPSTLVVGADGIIVDHAWAFGSRQAERSFIGKVIRLLVKNP